MTEKLILDATAGNRMMWFNKNHPNALYIDERAEVNPDLVADNRHLPQFADESFSLIVFDPPHFIDSRRGEAFKTMALKDSFGALHAETWPSDITKTAKELWRILKPNGVLVFKWGDHDINYKRVIKLFPVEPLFGQITNKNKYSKTLWFCFMKLASNANQQTRGKE
jgi:SAM-dependent methyltransferase